MFVVLTVAPAIYADGPEGKKEVMQPAPPVCELYRAHEWDLDIWGSFVFAGDTGTFDVPRVDPFSPDIDPTITNNTTTPPTVTQPQSQNPNERINLGRVSQNELIGRDDTFGGGVDLKYFWSRYFGAGIEGLGIASKTNFAGAELATFTVRYPFGRFAPYGFGGIGALEGGGSLYRFFNEKHDFVGGNVNTANTVNGGEREFWTDDAVYNHHTRAIGQLGFGLEYRVTCHVGLMADFSWNFVFGPEDHADRFHDIVETGQITTINPGIRGGPPVTTSTNIVNTAPDLRPGHGSDNQDFGMARFGFTFSY